MQQKYFVHEDKLKWIYQHRRMEGRMHRQTDAGNDNTLGPKWSWVKIEKKWLMFILQIHENILVLNFIYHCYHNISMYSIVTCKWQSSMVFLGECHLINVGWFPQDDYVLAWNHFPVYWPFTRRIHQSWVHSPHKVSVTRGALTFRLISPHKGQYAELLLFLCC